MTEPRRPDRPADAAALQRRQVELMREGARLDGVEIVHYEPRFPVPGTRAEKRAERLVAFFFLLTAAGGIGYLLVTILWPWKFTLKHGLEHLFTPLLGICMGVALFGLGAGMVYFAKALLPDEEAVHERHDGFSDEQARDTTAATLMEGYTSSGLGRRKIIVGTLGLGGLGLGALTIAPLGGLIKKPGRKLFETSWRKGVRLVRDDGTPVRPADIKPGGIETVFPGVPGGTKAPDSATLLFHLRPTDQVKIRPGRGDWHYQDFYAFSKICTHAGCPVGLYEQQDHRLLCPCHQSQFDVLDGCRPIFGPASRSLPQLAIGLDSEGYFVAKGDYGQAIGPAFWERG